MQSEKRTPESQRRTRTKRILTPDDWIDAATDLLVSKSIDAVRVESLARELGITIGSFYYHFKDRNDLLTKLLRRWHERTTAQVLRTFEGKTFRAEEALAEILALPFHGLTARRAAMIEFAIRAWARRDEMAREAVREVDQQRLAYYTRGFQEAGFGKTEAANRAFTLYSFQLAQSLLWELNDDKARKRQLNFTKELLLTPLREK
ncbi:TetR/AcrR family transcriptional regulator [Noviherbaspirillum massiliense]|uniref:TetR/AcrR family transcriptional regulator n=1 Tax=Noviherbaspirillum massiliense TaxID=1465823 RepID=UPI0002E0E92C|nr:TetR/AcrR family transcriptional regulator [Noviherbaspirillum massiliense]